MVAAENWKAKCLACGKEVTFASGFKCPAKPGNHRVESKRYYHTGGRDLQHPHDRGIWSPVLLYARPDKLGSGGKLESQAPLEIHFAHRGLLDSDDAEVQFNLETNSKGVGWGEAGKQTWDSIYLTPQTRQALADAKLAETNRQITEANSLLDQTRKRSEKRAEVA